MIGDVDRRGALRSLTLPARQEDNNGRKHVSFLFLASLALAADPTIRHRRRHRRTRLLVRRRTGRQGQARPAVPPLLRPGRHLYFSDTITTSSAGSTRRPKSSPPSRGPAKKGTPATAAAVKATLHEPYGIGIDLNGSLYIVDRLNYCVRRVDPTGVITTIMGNGKSEYGGDGEDATKARFQEPNGICVGNSGPPRRRRQRTNASASFTSVEPRRHLGRHRRAEGRPGRNRLQNRHLGTGPGPSAWAAAGTFSSSSGKGTASA